MAIRRSVYNQQSIIPSKKTLSGLLVGAVVIGCSLAPAIRAVGQDATPPKAPRSIEIWHGNRRVDPAELSPFRKSARQFAADKQSALKLLTSARAAADRGDIAIAIRLIQQAQLLQVDWSTETTSPEALLQEFIEGNSAKNAALPKTSITPEPAPAEFDIFQPTDSSGFQPSDANVDPFAETAPYAEADILQPQGQPAEAEVNAELTTDPFGTWKTKSFTAQPSTPEVTPAPFEEPSTFESTEVYAAPRELPTDEAFSEPILIPPAPVDLTPELDDTESQNAETIPDLPAATSPTVLMYPTTNTPVESTATLPADSSLFTVAVSQLIGAALGVVIGLMVVLAVLYYLPRRLLGQIGPVFRVELVNGNLTAVGAATVATEVEAAHDAEVADDEAASTVAIADFGIDAIPFQIAGKTYDDEQREEAERRVELEQDILKTILEDNLALRDQLADLDTKAA